MSKIKAEDLIVPPQPTHACSSDISFFFVTSRGCSRRRGGGSFYLANTMNVNTRISFILEIIFFSFTRLTFIILETGFRLIFDRINFSVSCYLN